MSTFIIPNSTPQIPVALTPDLSQDQLLAFPAFKIWLSTLQHSLSRQANPSHEFHAAPYTLRHIQIQAVDFFGGNRLGFVKLKADVSNDHGEKLPGSVFLRGGSVGILLILQPNDVPENSETDKHAILTIQPRIPAGSLAFPEIPAGMLDDDTGTFAGGAAKEIKEETGLVILQDELIAITALANSLPRRDQKQETRGGGEGSGRKDTNGNGEEKLQTGVYPSPGGCDEFIPLFLCQKRMARKEIEELHGKLTGLRKEGEKITLKVVKLEAVWREAWRDGKTLAAWALYRGLKEEGVL
ncbi:NUDIX family hydrolase [Blastomyces dermatitidis ER-3]|uniref:NUDIX family hydrolase n=1 Tax=Ajellomyces dermatitidis (strain ER-3 / ATCC MYA-2586) TaxID=559297 RepID=A0ABP2ETI1_AJEDR|nr:NUDIX family hydrolase [Blastomyces dermatitidis ER-3]EEQ87026.1 NUDIX family hydrolase [Blastomyces dermatitidis ER-3]